MPLPDVATFVAAAEKLYAETRDLSKHDATYQMARALLVAHSEGSTLALDEMKNGLELMAAKTPSDAVS